MPRYFFDIVDGTAFRDETGTDCTDDEAVRVAAMQVLPAVARDEIPGGSDRHTFTVVARDEQDRAIYTATLGFAGTWLNRRPAA